MSKKKCEICGSSISSTDTFCMTCGNPVKDNDVEDAVVEEVKKEKKTRKKVTVEEPKEDKEETKEIILDEDIKENSEKPLEEENHREDQLIK